MAAENGFKKEESSPIKMESSFPSHDMDDDDEYEDTGELHFPKSMPDAWLIRVPKDLWTAIDSMDPNDDVEIGKLHIWKQPNQKDKVRWKFSDKLPPAFEMIPKEYDMDQVDQNAAPRNLFVFSERDLPGFKPNLFRGFNRTQRQPQDSLAKTDAGRVDKKRRGPRTIPKHTAFVAVPPHELNCIPRENEDWFALQKRKEDELRASLSQPTIIAMKNPDATVSANPAFPTTQTKRPKNPDNKYQRLPEAQLLDTLAGLFREYPYWRLRDLKERTRQPEQYLREVLGRIAVLHKSGQTANLWALKQTAALAANLTEADVLAHAAPSATNQSDDEDGDEDEDDDDGEDMEDVV